MEGKRRRFDLGALILGLILLFVGGYYLLRNTLGINLPEIKGDQIWPVVVIAVGAAIIYGVWTSRPGADDQK